MVIMEQDDLYIRSLQLSSVPKSTRDILSNLLNPEKVLPAQGQLCRDWRGLADLAGLTSQVQASIRTSADQTAKVLQLWDDHNSVKVGELLEFLEFMDRFDVVDDLREDLLNSPVLRRDQIVGLRDNLPRLIPEDEEEDEVLTYDDSQGYKHLYDAYVLYSDQDKYFVESMIDYLDPRGFKICTKEKLLPGHTKYPSLAKLISERCQRIILVYSPDFLHSPAETFFRDYAQAISIESRKNKIIPIMYRDCHLPAHLAVYHNLRYESEMYSFWNKLTITLNNTKLARITAGHSPVQPRQIQMSQSHSALNIVEVSASNLSFPNVDEDRLSQASSPSSPFSTLEGSSPDGSIASDTSEVVRQKKSAKIIKFFKIHRKNKRNKSKDEEKL